MELPKHSSKAIKVVIPMAIKDRIANPGPSDQSTQTGIHGREPSTSLPELTANYQNTTIGGQVDGGMDEGDLSMAGGPARRRRSTKASYDHESSMPSRGMGEIRRGKRGGLGKGFKGVKRGLRNPMAPAFEFKALHSEATMAFINNDYDRAEDLTLQAIQHNPEMFEAHSLMSQIHTARGDTDKAIAALWNGAHTRSRDVKVWSHIARLLLERDPQATLSTLRDAVYCYTRVIVVETESFDARFQRALLNRQLGYPKRSVQEYEQILRMIPHDPAALRLLAEVCIEIDDPERALTHYQAAIDHAQDLDPREGTGLNWSDVNIVAELHGFQREYSAGVIQIKRLGRWLLGRAAEEFWEDYEAEDREWDATDEPRRLSTPEFVPSQYEPDSYGLSLPLELRVKLGIFRLRANPDDNEEALNHFAWLEPAGSQGEHKVFDFPDLFRDAAKALLEAGLHSAAIEFYEPLQNVTAYFDESCRRDLSACYAVSKATRQADNTVGNAYHPQQEPWDEPQQSSRDGTQQNSSDEPRQSSSEHADQDPMSIASGSRIQESVEAATLAAFTASVGMLAPAPPRKKYKNRRPRNAMPEVDDLDRLYTRWRDLRLLLGTGLPETRQSLLMISRKMIEIFRRQTIFFPGERQKFLGYYRGAGQLAKNMRKQAKGQIVSDTPLNEADLETPVPDHLGDIPFSQWLDIFLEYALEMSKDGKMDDAYDVLGVASLANVFRESPPAIQLVYVCWFSCSLMANDDNASNNVARWFMKEYQFVSDAYRLFSALHRLSDSDHTWHNANTTQKFLLRQVKVVDFSLQGGLENPRGIHEKASFFTKDDLGQPILAEELDLPLLMMYGHVLCAGKSFAYAINYFLRALTLDPSNPIIKMSLGLSYVHCAWKRQASNRHQLIAQGMAFMLDYHESRQATGTPSEKQEAFFNVGRLYHMLGLTQLALPYYERCLEMDSSVCESVEVGESFACEAALALQNIWTTNGNWEKAMDVTERWLQI